MNDKAQEKAPKEWKFDDLDSTFFKDYRVSESERRPGDDLLVAKLQKRIAKLIEKHRKSL